MHFISNKTTAFIVMDTWSGWMVFHRLHHHQQKNYKSRRQIHARVSVRKSATHDAMSALFCDLPCQTDLIRSYSYHIPPRTRTKLPTHHVSLPAEPNTVCLLIHIYVYLLLCPQPLYSIVFVKRIPRNVCIYYNTKQMGGPKAPSLSSQI